MTSFGIYRCGHCGAQVTRQAASCPQCHAILNGVRCEQCSFTGTESDFVGDRCPKCGSIVVISAGAPYQPPPPRPRPKVQHPPGWRNPALYVLASVAVPGLGSFLCGRRNRGLLIFGLSVTAIIGVTLVTDALLGGPPHGYGGLLAIPLWIWGIVDAAVAVQQWNKEHAVPPVAATAAPTPEAAPSPQVPALVGERPGPAGATETARPGTVHPPIEGLTAVPAGERDRLVGKLEAELIDIGRHEGYVGNPDGTYDEHWNHRRARQIGAMLNDLGGMELMLEAHAKVAEEFSATARPRELEACWGGVGHWMR